MKNNLGNKKIFAQNLLRYMNLNNKERIDLCNDLDFPYTTVTGWINAEKYPRIDKIEKLADYFKIDKSDLIEEPSNSENHKTIPINIFDRIAADDALSKSIGTESIPSTWATGGEEYIALKISGNSMYPLFIDNDIVIVKLQNTCESGDYALVYIKGIDTATVKTLIKQDDGMIRLQPTNPEYPPKTLNPESITIIGVVKRLRRDF